MASHYTLKGFIRQVSRRLLADYLRYRGIELSLDLDRLKPRNIEPIVEAINRLPDEPRARLDQDFQDIFALASKAGLQHALAEGRLQDRDLQPELQPLKSCLDKAIWTFVNASGIFGVAARLAAPDLLPGRYWKRRLPLAGAPGVDLSGTVRRLEAALSIYFQRDEGRGRACKIDYLNRQPLHRFHAFPEDYGAAPLEWSSSGLNPRPSRPVFEVIFVYDEVQGTLDIYVEAGKETVERLWQLFGEVVLGLEEVPNATKPAYRIEGLKARSFAFVRPAGSPIVDVRVRRLSLLVPGGGSRKVAVEADDSHALHATLDCLFARDEPEPGRFALSQTRVLGARLSATIDRRDGARPRVRTFDISQKSCALRYNGTDMLLRQMLADSGIDLTGGSGNAAPDAARPAPSLAAE